MTLKQYPLLFATRELVAGNGFIAGVRACGRVLMVQEEESEWWIYGVEPGGIAERGETPKEAHLQFVTGMRNALHDFAGLAGSFDDFKAEVTRFTAQVDPIEDARWQTAVQTLRAGAEVSDPFFASLERWAAEKKCEVEIVLLNLPAQASVELNPRERIAIPELAAA